MHVYRLYYRGEKGTNYGKVEAIKALRRTYNFSLQEAVDIVSEANKHGQADFTIYSDFLMVAGALPGLYELEPVTPDTDTGEESENSVLPGRVSIEDIRALMYRALDNRQYELLETLLKARETIS